MKNADCVIYITTMRGWIQRYVKENDGWTQTGPNGTVRRLSAEQLLSHRLPRLAADRPGPHQRQGETEGGGDELAVVVHEPIWEELRSSDRER